MPINKGFANIFYEFFYELIGKETRKKINTKK